MRTGKLADNPLYAADGGQQKLRWPRFINEHPDNMLAM